MAIPSIDLHPENFSSPGRGPGAALAACRSFLLAQWEAGRPEGRVITGIGIHGDGTPRLRLRVEREILPGLHDKIEEVSHEQGGAVLRVRFRKNPRGQESALRQADHEAQK